MSIKGNVIERGDLGKIIKAKTTHMDANPFDCTCLKEIKKWANEHDKDIDIFYTDMNCTTDRLRHKMDDLEKRIKEIREENGIEERTTKPALKPKIETFEDEVEILFK